MPAALKLPSSKLAVAVAASCIAITVPLYFLPKDLAILTVKHGGYWFMLGTCALFLWAFWRETRKVSARQLRELASQHSMGLLLAATIAVFIQAEHEDSFRILYDEHVLSSTAMNLHAHQLAYVQAVSHVVEGETVASIGHVDKRPLLFPFILSIGHNLFGYDHTHVFALNAALTFLTLALLYGLLTKLTNRTYGCLGLLLFGGLPLLAQNANGGGYEVLNLCLILGLGLTAIHYFRQTEDTASLDLMIMAAILLANVRYESILYVLLPATIFLIKGLRTGELKLTWFSAFSPLLLIPPLLSFGIFSNEPLFIRTSPDNFFSLGHLPGNLAQAMFYLFDWSGDYNNSLLLSLLGLPSILLLIIYGAPQLRTSVRKENPAIVLYPALLIVLANTLLALCNHWGAWTDPTTSRFSLPLQLAMAISSVLVIHTMLRQATTATVGLIILAGSHLIFVAPRCGEFQSQSHRLYLAKGYDWAMQWVTLEAPPGNHLYIAQSASGLGLLQVGAIPFSVANTNSERILRVKETGIYDEVFAFEGLIAKGEDTRLPLPGAGSLSQKFKLEKLGQFYLNAHTVYRISRIVGPRKTSTKDPTAHNPRLQGKSGDVKQSPDIYELLPLTP